MLWGVDAIAATSSVAVEQDWITGGQAITPGGPIPIIPRNGGRCGKIKLNTSRSLQKCRVYHCMDAMPIPGITGVADLPR